MHVTDPADRLLDITHYQLTLVRQEALRQALSGSRQHLQSHAVRQQYNVSITAVQHMQVENRPLGGGIT